MSITCALYPISLIQLVISLSFILRSLKLIFGGDRIDIEALALLVLLDAELLLLNSASIDCYE